MTATPARRCGACGALVCGAPCPGCGAAAGLPHRNAHVPRRLEAQAARGPAYLAAPARPLRETTSYVAFAALALTVVVGATWPPPHDSAAARPVAVAHERTLLPLATAHAELTRLATSYPPTDRAAWSVSMRTLLAQPALREPAAGPAEARAAAGDLRAAALHLAGLATAPDPIARDPVRVQRVRHAIDAARPTRARTPEVPTHVP